MNRTMPMMNGKKDMGNTGSSSVNLASKATANTMTNTQNKTVLSHSHLNATSPFANSATRGIVSGMGLLTF